jgi:ABC-2 type transport system permease protein|tara:strand:+ start:548 stop:1312 length:765 start_codon:yes stop_codon:yes gene_type:complete
MINYLAIKAIYFHEMNRTRRTILQSIISPILSTSLYFIIFGSAIGSRIKEIDGVTYGMFIVPGLLMLNILTQSVSNGSFSTYFPKFNGTIYELQAAPISGIEMIIGFVGATATKSIILGTLIILTASFFIDLNVAHPFLMVFFLIMTSITFSLFGFIIGLWANNFEKLSLIPLIVITPLVFLGGSFYSISMLPDIWQKISLFNPVLYLVSGFKYSFYEISDVSIFTSISTIVLIFMILMFITLLIFKKGYNLRD